MSTLVKSAGQRRMALLQDKDREAILAFCKIAEASGALLSLRDLGELLGSESSEDELAKGISDDRSLSQKVEIAAGRVVLKREGMSADSLRAIIEEDERRRERATANLAAARSFSRFLGDDALFVAVGGTNSYLSAAENDDIDFYCITKTDGMWIFMLKALLLARVYNIFGRVRVPFCFSFVMDENKAIQELTTPKGGLYARDSLNAKVISGAPEYRRILEKASWMRSYFPAVFDRALRDLGPSDGASGPGERGSRAINLFLFVTVGSYVALRAWLTNRRLAKWRKPDAVFKAWVEPGRLEYAARRYLQLGKMYPPPQGR